MVFASSYNPNDTRSEIIQNQPFFPNIDLEEFTTAVRLQDSVTDQRVLHALKTSMFDVNRELSAWRDQQIDDGYEHLADLPSDYSDLHEFEHYYLTAVYSGAKAYLIEVYKDSGTTEEGLKRFIQFNDSADVYQREKREAIRQILGVDRVTVELI